jgi:alkanesulfonate monooxygenase SsuD/methylene tetrahydromethanopterin reductase-like flavin-dependent oxidoreductase (luciferase family)
MDLSLMFAGGGGMTVRDMVDLAVRAEEAGADGVYLPEAWRSGFVTPTAIAAATSRIRVGPYVLNAHSRTPWIAGMAAVDLDEFSGGRLVLGVGSGNKVTNESYQGVSVVRPLEKMRDYVRVLRAVTSARLGDRVDVPGARHSVSGWHSQVTPVRDRIPILLAATSPKMTDLAAEVADGIALGSLQSSEFIDRIARRCRETAGPDFKVVASGFVATDPDRDVARAAAKEAVLGLFAGKPHPHYESLLRQQGFSTVADEVLAAVAADDIDRARKAIPDEVIDTLTIAGTPEECIERLGEYEGIVDDFVLVNSSGMRYQEGDGISRAGAQLRSFDSVLALVDAAKKQA